MSNETACESVQQLKYVNLLQIHHKISDIEQHIKDLNNKFGVRPRNDGQISAPTQPEIQKEPDPDSLVSVLDQLPGMATFCIEHRDHTPFMVRDLITGRMKKAI